MADEMNPEQPQPQQSQTGLSQAYLESALARKQEAERQMQKLMDALNVRKNMPFDPVLMRVAGALLQPTKTGSFGESLGYATTAAADESEKQAMRGIELAKMEFELSQKREAQQKAMDALKLRQQFFGGKPAAPTAPAAPAAPLLTAMPPVEAAPLTSEPQQSTFQSPAVLPEEMPRAPVAASPAGPPAAPAGYQSRMPKGLDALLMMESDPELYKLLSEEDKRLLEEAKFGLDVRKTEAQERVPIESGGVKFSVPKIDADRMSNAIEKKDYKTAQRLYEKYALPFPFVKEGENYRLKTPAEAAEEIEVAKAIETKPYFIPEVGGTVLMLPRDFKAYREAVKENKGEEWVDKNLRRKPVGGEPTKGETKPFLTEEQRAAKAKGEETYAAKTAEESAKERASIMESGKTAMALAEPVSTVMKIASHPVQSKALGLLEEPNLGSAVLGTFAEGVKVGPFNVGMPSVREAVAKVTNDPKEREQILDALQTLKASYSTINLLFSRIYLANQGAVTEGERALVAAATGGVANRKTVALAQAEMLQQKMAFDREVKSRLLRWEKANPGGRYEDFTQTKEFEDLYSNFSRNTNAVYNKYFGERGAEPKAESKAEPKAEPKAAAPAGSLRERIDAAKKARGL